MGCRRHPVAVLVLTVALTATCTEGLPTEAPAAPGAPSRAEPPSGGRLRVAVFWPTPLDPQRSYGGTEWELFRCCLLRTLYAYPGAPTEEGGSQVRPDLAEGEPQVSGDGLVWTFRLKAGIRYAPPFEDRVVVSGDFVRALEREAEGFDAGVAGYGFYYSVIAGFDEFRQGSADRISGLETPDERTLVIRLIEPVGDLAHRFSMPATAPIPEGAVGASGSYHGLSLASTGPYLLQERTRAGLSLVRNPSWDPTSDPIRGAFVDRIEVENVLDVGAYTPESSRVWERVRTGALDAILDVPVNEVLASFGDDPALADNVLRAGGGALTYMPINMAVPPFDDIHVRRAVNLAVDKDAVIRDYSATNGAMPVTPATHVLLDSLETNLLSAYDPYPGPDLAAASAEMARSRYDEDGDGVCDADACRRVVAVAVREQPDVPSIDRDGCGVVPQVAKDLAQLGIDLDVVYTNGWTYRRWKMVQAGRAAIGVGCFALFPEFLSGSTVFVGYFASDQVDEGPFNASLVGATPEQLRALGFPPIDLPSVDERIAACQGLVGPDQSACWAQLDQYTMEEVVPWVPVWVYENVTIVSERLVRAPMDQWTGTVALDQAALAPGS